MEATPPQPPTGTKTCHVGGRVHVYLRRRFDESYADVLRRRTDLERHRDALISAGGQRVAAAEIIGSPREATDPNRFATGISRNLS